MSRLFYDHLIILEDIEVELDKAGLAREEREEIENLIEEMVHHRVLGRILQHLPREHHEEFLHRFHEAPHDEQLIQYINEKVEEEVRGHAERVERHIKNELEKLKKEILEDLRSSTKK